MIKVELTNQELNRLQYLIRCEKLSLERANSSNSYKQEIYNLYKKFKELGKETKDE